MGWFAWFDGLGGGGQEPQVLYRTDAWTYANCPGKACWYGYQALALVRRASIMPRQDLRWSYLVGAGAGQHVVDAGIAAEVKASAQRVIRDAFEFVGYQAGGADEAGQFGWFDKACVVVGAARQHFGDVFGADHGKQVGGCGAVEGGKEHFAARFDQLHAGGDDGGGVGHVFEHFHAGDDVIASRFACGERFCCDFFVTDGNAAFQAMQVGYAQRFAGEVDAFGLGPEFGHRFGEDAAAAADVEHFLARKLGMAVDPLEPDRVQVVQGFEFGLRIPPAMREFTEFLQFMRVGIGHRRCF